MQVKWKHLNDFIQEQLKKDPNFLEKGLMIEMVSPDHCQEKSGWARLKDSEGWEYVEPAWFQTTNQEEPVVLATTFKDKDVVTLNINY